MRVSLAGWLAFALALREGATRVTTGHHEFDPVAETGICPVLFPREDCHKGEVQ